MTPDPFAPPRSESAGDVPVAGGELADPHLLIATATLALLGLQAFGMALAMPPIGALGASGDPDFRDLPMPWLWGTGLGLVGASFLAVYGGACLTGAYGIRRADKTGLALGLIAFGVVATGCPLIAAHGLFALLRPEARRRFGVA